MFNKDLKIFSPDITYIAWSLYKCQNQAHKDFHCVLWTVPKMCRILQQLMFPLSVAKYRTNLVLCISSKWNIAFYFFKTLNIFVLPWYSKILLRYAWLLRHALLLKHVQLMLLASLSNRSGTFQTAGSLCLFNLGTDVLNDRTCSSN